MIQITPKTIVAFVYEHGEYPNALRVVYATTVDDIYVTGFDLTRMGWRTFYVSKIKSAHTVEDMFTTVKMSDFGIPLFTQSDIIKKIEEKGKFPIKIDCETVLAL